MAEFRGFKCDECNGIIEDTKDRTKQRVRFESEAPERTGEYFRDLCVDCANRIIGQSQDTMTPLRRRRPRGSGGDATPSRVA